MAIFYFPNPASPPANSVSTGSPFVASATGPIQPGDYYVDGNNAPTVADSSSARGKISISWPKYAATPTIGSGGSPIKDSNGVTIKAPAPTISATAVVTTPITIAAGSTSPTVINVSGGAAFYALNTSLVLYNVSLSPALPAGLTLVPTYAVSTVNNNLYNTASYTLQASSSFVAPSVNTTYTVTFTDQQSQTGSATITLAAGASVPKPTATGSTTLVTLYTTIPVPATPPLQPVTATGGTAPLKFTATLPAGLSMDSTGVITGTPTAAAAQANITVTVTDANNQTATATFPLVVIAASKLAVTSSQTAPLSFPVGTIITAFSPATISSPGVTPYTYSIDSSFHTSTNLNLNSDGSISGTASNTAVAAATYTVTVTDAIKQTGTATFNLAITASELVAKAASPSAYTFNKGIAITAFTPVTATGGQKNYTFSVSSPSLPAGLSMDSNGQITGTPTVAVTTPVTYTVTVNDSSSPTYQTATATITIQVNDVTALSTALASSFKNITGNVGTAITPVAPVTATGGYLKTGDSYKFAVTGTPSSLPAGLSLDPKTGQITGTPTVATALTTYTITVTDDTPNSIGSSQPVGIVIFSSAITLTQAVPTVTLTKGVAIPSASPIAPITAKGGTAPLTFTCTGLTALGLAMDSSGNITGTPTSTTSSPQTFTVNVVDSTGQTGSGTNTFQLVINAPANIVPAKSQSSYSFILGTAVPSTQLVTATGGLGPPYTYSISPDITTYSTHSTGLAFSTTTGQLSGTPTVLIPSTAYTITVTDSAGTPSVPTNQSVNITVGYPALTLTVPNATVTLQQYDPTGLPFQPVTATGGVGTITYSISPDITTYSSLPTNLTFSTATGKISGIPAVQLSATYTITATDSAGTPQTGSKTFNLVVSAAPVPPAVTTTLSTTVTFPIALVTGQQAVSLVPVTASGGTGTVTLTISPSLPSGLKFQSSGQIIGDPTPSAISPATTYTVTATDQYIVPQTSSKTFILSVAAPTAITTTVAAASTTLTQGLSTGIPLQPVTATGGFGTLTFTVSPNLPAGLSMDPTGNITGIPTAFGPSTTYTVTVTDQAGQSNSSSSFNLTVTPVPLTTTLAISSPKTLIQKVKAESFTPVTTNGGYGGNVFSISPTLPSGLTFDTTTGTISGTATVTLSQNTFTVTVTDSFPHTSSTTFDLIVNAPPTLQLQLDHAAISLTRGQDVSANPPTGYPTGGLVPVSVAANYNGYGTITFSINPSALPTGLTYANNTISGTPAKLFATSSFTITAVDSIGQTDNKSFSLTVVDPALVVTATNPTNTFYQATAITAFNSVTATGGSGTYTTYAISPALPTGLSFSTTTGQITGTPTDTSTSSSYTVTVTDSDANTGTATFAIAVNAPGPLDTTLATATISEIVGVNITASNPVTRVAGTGYGTITFAISPDITTQVPGIIFDKKTGTISGFPGALLASTAFTITATDSTTPTPYTSSKTFQFAVVPPPIKSTVVVPSLVLTEFVQMTNATPVTATGGVPPLKFTATLPSGLSMNPDTGEVSGTPNVVVATATTYTVTITDSNSPTPQTDSTSQFTITIPKIVPPALTLTVTQDPFTITQGLDESGSALATAAGGFLNVNANYAYTLTPDIATTIPGITFDPTSGVINGTTTDPKFLLPPTPFTITVTDSVPQTQTATFNIQVKADSSAGAGGGGKGYTGSKGFTGSRAYTGSQGYSGSRGVAGFTGSQGYWGSVGYTGSQGYYGSVGFTGSQGYWGSFGYTGSQGDQGYWGSAGYTGSQGYYGSVGFTGSQGIAGYWGSVGYTGSWGYFGSTGYTGSQGYWGSSGFMGSTGYTGSASSTPGYTGSQGYYGSVGFTGSAGSSTALSNGSHTLTINNDGSVQFPFIKFPPNDGTAGQTLVTDGNGNLSWSSGSSLTVHKSLDVGTKSAVSIYAVEMIPDPGGSGTNIIQIQATAPHNLNDSDYVTIVYVQGTEELNFNSYFVKVISTDTVILFQDSALTTPVVPVTGIDATGDTIPYRGYVGSGTMYPGNITFGDGSQQAIRAPIFQTNNTPLSEPFYPGDYWYDDTTDSIYVYSKFTPTDGSPVYYDFKDITARKT